MMRSREVVTLLRIFWGIHFRACFNQSDNVWRQCVIDVLEEKAMQYTALMIFGLLILWVKTNRYNQFIKDFIYLFLAGIH